MKRCGRFPTPRRWLFPTSIAGKIIRFLNKTQQQWSGEAGPGFGQPFEELWAANSYHNVQPHVASALAEQLVSFEDMLTFRDDKRRDVLGMLIPRFGRHGQVRGFDCLLTDVTERNRARQALRQNEGKLRALLESVPQGIISVETGGNIVQANRTGETLFGYGREELIGQPIEM